MPYNHFKMETLKSVTTLITPGCYMTKTDIKHVYYPVPTLEDHQKYLKFLHKTKLYKFFFLPNGYALV